MDYFNSITINNNYREYGELIKPDWAPPEFLFGPVWTILYIIIAITFTRVFLMWRARKISSLALLPFIVNIISNLLFTPIQFGLKNNIVASVDIIFVLISLIIALKLIYKHNKYIALANIPYLLWVIFATCLQLTITYLNF